MADQSERTTRLATLFEDITDQSTITEAQQIDIAVRYDGHGEAIDLADYLEATAQGFDDVIEEPETY